MRKLILILLAFLAVFTYIRAFERAEASTSTTGISAEVTGEIPVEIVR
ncbi:MAG: hypothetical protein LBQ89_00585 [Treponema sp.]|jgi:hypothetical protein|nr:hypothetical protein [Treponema sp.]